MARLAICFAALLSTQCTGFVLKGNSSAPITETVTIDSVEVYGSSSGTRLEGKCVDLAESTVSNERQPVVNVCGTGTKVTVFLRNRCVQYHHYQLEIGSCDKGAPSTTCQEQSPATESWLHTAQSYRVEPC